MVFILSGDGCLGRGWGIGMADGVVCCCRIGDVTLVVAKWLCYKGMANQKG